MPRLAAEVLAAYRDTVRERFLENRFRLELLTGDAAAAGRSLAEARALRVARRATPEAAALHVQYEILARARVRAAASGQPLSSTFADAFRETFAGLDDRTAALVGRAIQVSPGAVASDLRWATPDLTGRSEVALEEALTLLRVYSAVEAYRAFAGLPVPLVGEDERRRYVTEQNVAVRTPDGATLCTIVVRPRSTSARLPALLQFTIYADSVATRRDALRSASNGYAGVIGFTRGKACSPDPVVPYVHDGVDAAALIDWIAAQPWSDGRVGMYGGSYSGFTPWAAAKHAPRALRAIMTGAPVAPGIDAPMEGNIFWNFVYPWPFYTTNDRWLDNATYNDNQRWSRLYDQWYRSGRPYRELAQIDGTPNPGFDAWLAHPTLDAYWKATIPNGAEFAKIRIPVLQTAGYFFGGPGAAMHYFHEHLRHNPRAAHTLVIGPWDHLQAQRGVVTAVGDTATWLAGYTIDPVAQIDLVADLRYRWFDHVLRGGPKPALLVDRLNYQVMGANVWKSAPTAESASPQRLRLYLAPERTGARYGLRSSPAVKGAAIAHSVDLADRSDADAIPPGGLLATEIDTANAVVLVSDPLPRATELTGFLSGRLELIVNRKDFDFSITPYEWTADGSYYQLPPYQSRASHVASLSERKLLTPGRRERLDFAGRLRMMSRRVAAGSRIVLVLAVLRNPRQQINYGTGGDVSAEALADADGLVRIEWLGGSYIDLPVGRD